MSQQQHNIREIYNLLFAGKSVEIEFVSALDAENFRTRLAKYKMLQDRAMVNLGILAEEEKDMFRFQLDRNTWKAKISFDKKPELKKYQVKILDEDHE